MSYHDRFASGGQPPRPRRAEGARLRRDRGTRQTTRFSCYKDGEFEGVSFRPGGRVGQRVTEGKLT
jgi:hypothetical protein